ncbi:MAG: hypothetical protein QME79_06245 [Bacillota bacterium]|nr:hypothetical protein [Bacillota bacterium]
MRNRWLPVTLGAVVVLWASVVVTQAAANVSGELALKVTLPTGDDSWVDNQLAGLSELKLAVDAEAGGAAYLHAVLRATDGYGSSAGAAAVGLDEAYVDLARGDLTLRLGKQRVLWGSGYKVNPTSFVNPVNPEDPLGERTAVSALSAGYAVRDLRLNAVLIPEFKPAVVLGSVPMPSSTLENAEYALKVTKRGIAGFDASLSYYHGWEDQPTYPGVNRLGLDLVGAVGDAGLWLEGAASKQQSGREYTEIVAGADYTTNGGLYLVGQYYVLSPDHPVAEGKKRDYAIVVGRKTVGDHLTAQVSGLYAVAGGDSALLPELTFNLADGTNLVMGLASVTKGTSDPLLRQVANQVYAKLTLSF